MVFPSLKRLLGIKEKKFDIKEKLLGGEDEEEPVDARSEIDYYTVLEDEKLPPELIPEIIGFLSRDLKLSYLEQRDMEYLFWRGIALKKRIFMALDHRMPKPERFRHAEDYARYVEASMNLVDNLDIIFLANVKRARYGFTANRVLLRRW